MCKIFSGHKKYCQIFLMKDWFQKTNKEEFRRLLIILNIFWTQSQYYLFDTGAPAEICGHEFVFNVI